MVSSSTVEHAPEFELVSGEAAGEAILQLRGIWRVQQGRCPSTDALTEALEEQRPERLRFDLAQVSDWDSAILPAVLTACRWADEVDAQVDLESLPEGLRRLVRLASAVPEKPDAERSPERSGLSGFFERVGQRSLRVRDDIDGWFEFIGRVSVALLALARGRARVRRREFLAVLENVGVRSLPIVTLISFLIGAIIAFLGAVVLQRFGATYYVSYLVGYGMLREMAAVMTGVILSGRLGAAFAAQIGSMKVTEEIDALKVLAIDEVEYLVLPRLSALVLMMPLLVIYANVVGILGGYIVSASMLDMALPMFNRGLLEAVSPIDLWLGLFKGLIFGIIIAVSGCIRGLQCGKTADAVGQATTSAVVTAITLIVAVNALIDWIAAIYSI